MDPRDAATMALIAGPAVVLGSSLVVLLIWRVVRRRPGNPGAVRQIVRWYRTLPHRRR